MQSIMGHDSWWAFDYVETSNLKCVSSNPSASFLGMKRRIVERDIMIWVIGY